MLKGAFIADTRDILDALLATSDEIHHGIRDRAILMLAFARGGRQRLEVSSLNVEETRREDFNAKGLLWARLLEAKTTKKDQAPKLHLKGCSARAVVHWLEVTGLKDGSLFRVVSRPAPASRP